jgi:hypothetical protein
MALPLAALLPLLAAGGAGLGYGVGKGKEALFGKGTSGGLGEFFMGAPEKEMRFQRFGEGQQDILGQLLQQGFGEVSGTGIEDLARKRFQEETIPGIAERFTSMGAGGQRSSAFQGALGRAGSDLESQLAALKQQGGMQKLGLGLQPQFESAYRPPGTGALHSLISMLPLLSTML